MTKVRFANAPCSWGVLEFDEVKPLSSKQMLDELQLAGYMGTELGDYGFFSTDPAELKGEITRRNLSLIGAFGAYALWDPTTYGAGRAYCRKVGVLLQAFQGSRWPPHLVLSDNVSDKRRIENTGRLQPSMSLDREKWANLVREAQSVKRMMREEFGVAVYFHPHCGSFVETTEEIKAFLRDTDLDLVFDCGHVAMGSNNPDAVTEILDTFPSRIHTFHFKDFDPKVLREGGNYFDLVNRGIFCELGKGSVDFAKIKQWQEKHKYDGWIVVEQDVLAGMGSPLQSAQRNFAFLLQLYGIPSKL